MATNPSENSRKYMGIVVDRDDPNGLGGHKIFVPQLHGHNVNVDHLPWVRYTVPPGGGGGSTNYGALDNGQLVAFEKDIGEGGTGFGTIVGLYQTKQKADPNMPGNISLVTTFQQVSQALEKESNIRVRPTIEEKEENGAVVRKAVEKGIKHKHSLLKEMASHAATFPLNGTVLPQITNVSTGVESAISQLTASMQSMLPGMPLNLSNILSMIPAPLMDELTKAVPPEVFAAIQNTTALMGSVSTMATDGASSGRKVDPIAFATTAVELFKGARTPADVASAFAELTSNTAIGSVAGEGINLIIETPFGQITQSLDPVTGAITAALPDAVQDAIKSFGSLMGAIPGAGGGSLFGDSTEVISQMGQRLAKPELVAKFKEKMELNMSTALGTEARKAMNEIGSAANSFAIGAKKFLG